MMKKIHRFLATAVVGLAFAAPAKAQNLSWYGLTACFTNSTYAYDNGGHKSVHSDCSANNGTVRNRWGSASNSNYRSWVEFERGAPYGPGDQGSNDPLTLTFGGINSWNIFSLGRVEYRNGLMAFSNGYSILGSTRFNLWMYFDATGTPSMQYNDEVLITNYEDGGTDHIWWTYRDGNPWQTFSVNGHDYEFRIAGLDWTSHDKCEEIQDLDFMPEKMQAGAEDKTKAQLCGKIYYRGPSTTVPEPGTYALLAAGLAGLGVFGRRRISTRG